MKVCLAVLLAVSAIGTAAVAAPSAGYHISGQIAVGGAGYWDYLVDDAARHRLYMSHNANIEVVDTASGRHVGSIAIGGFTRGIAIAEGANRAYVTSGQSPLSTAEGREVVAFDLSTLAIVQRIPLAAIPDGIVFEPVSNSILAFQRKPNSVTVIAADSGRVVRTIPLSGKPEASVADGRGSVFVNYGDSNAIARIDVAALLVASSWPLPECDGASGLAMDRRSRRLFAACDNSMLAVVNADTGTVVSRVAVAPKSDGVAYDPETHRIFISTFDGTLSIVSGAGSDRYELAQNLPTTPGSKTLALDVATHTVYLSSAKFAPPKDGDPFPRAVDGTFAALIVSEGQR
jgi:DNA-binding beta-propeller fold protein YncE